MPRSWTPPTSSPRPESADGHHGRMWKAESATGYHTADADEQLRQVDVCFVMDATGSMAPYLDAARLQLKDLASTMSAHPMHPKMAYALVQYRDHPPQDSSFVTKITPLSEDLSTMQSALDVADAAGGGDGPEAVVDGLFDAVNKLQWRKGAHRVILLVGDSPPHGQGAPGDGFAEQCPCGHDPLAVARAAYERGIAIFALGVGDGVHMQQSFREIARLGGGNYHSLSNAGALVDQILRVTTREFSKVDIDRMVYPVYKPGMTPAAVAAATGLTEDTAKDSLDRLRRKEMIR